MAPPSILPSVLNRALVQRGLQPLGGATSTSPTRLDSDGVSRWVSDFQTGGGTLAADQRKVIDQVLKALDSQPLFDVMAAQPAQPTPQNEQALAEQKARNGRVG